MKDSINSYSSGLQPYKAKKLFFSQHFKTLYYQRDSELSILQCEYKLCTHMWLQRLREEDIVLVMGWWYRRHNIQGNWGRLRHQIIPETYYFTRPILKEQRNAEYQRAKQRRRSAQNRGAV